MSDEPGEVRNESSGGHKAATSAIMPGKNSRQQSVVEILACFDLPGPIRQLIGQVASRTRLWRREQLEIVAELAAHFRDGLDAGCSEDELIRRFGDPGKAATLIRRAKKRNRPTWWLVSRRAIKTTAVALAAMVVLYLVVAVRFYLGEPVIRVDYVAQLNTAAGAMAVAEEDRAWPLYREAFLVLRGDDDLFYFAGEKPDSTQWPSVREKLPAYRYELDLIRRAAMKPALGYTFAMTSHDEDEEVLRRAWSGWSSNAALDGLIVLPQPYLGAVTAALRYLMSDTHLAIEEGDSERVRDNILSCIRAALQFRGSVTRFDQLLALGFITQGSELIGDVLAVRPELLHDDDLRTFAHELAAAGGVQSIRYDFRGERMIFEDFVQRAYTDDGRNGGRITKEGMELLATLVEVAESERVSSGGLIYAPVMMAGGMGPTFLRRTIAPGASVIVADRREIVRVYDRIMAQIESESATPLWMLEGDSLRMLEQLAGQSMIRHNRYLPVLALLPGAWQGVIRTEYATQQRDAALAAIALELYRRRHGEWPESLDALTPHLLPRVPLDRYDGSPLRYRVRDGRAMLYSVGTNRMDNGGEPAIEPRRGVREAKAAMWWVAATELGERDVPEGDWVLWETR